MRLDVNAMACALGPLSYTSRQDGHDDDNRLAIPSHRPKGVVGWQMAANRVAARLTTRYGALGRCNLPHPAHLKGSEEAG